MKTLKVLGGMIFLVLSFFLLLLLLEQPVSVALMDKVIGGMVILLWVAIPLSVSLFSFSMLFVENRAFTLLVSFSMGLLLMSNITFSIFLNIAYYDFGIAFIILFVWGSTCLFVIALFLKLLYGYFFKKNMKALLRDIFTITMLKSLLLSSLITVVLFQLYLVGNAIEVYKAVKIMNVKESNAYTPLSFYRPYVYEIRLNDGQRWSYSRLKFVKNGR